MENYSSLKWREILTYATTWLDLNNNILHERNQPQKDKYYVILFKQGV